VKKYFILIAYVINVGYEGPKKYVTFWLDNLKRRDHLEI